MSPLIALAASGIVGLWTVQQAHGIHPLFSLLIQQLGLHGNLTALCLLFGIGIAIQTNSTQPRKNLGLLCMGFFGAYCLASLSAAERLLAQVPLECHKTEVAGEFRLLDQNLRQNGKVNWIIEHNTLHACLPDQARLSMNIEGQIAAQSAIQVGDFFSARVSLRALHAPLQLQGFDVHRHWMSRGISGLATLKSLPSIQQTDPSWNPLLAMARARHHIRQWLQHALHGSPHLPLITAMVIGDQGLISPEERELYNDTGIAHLVAVSGLHITLFALIAGRTVQFLWKQSATLCLLAPSPWVGALGGLLFAGAYALIAGWAPPAQRTVFMLLALLISQHRHSNSSPWDTWALAMLLTMAGDPWSVLDFGFLLSFGAVAVLIYTHHGRYNFTRTLPNWIAGPLKAQYVVTIGLLVPSIAMFNQQSLVSILVNGLSIPWMTFISTPLALLGGLLHQHWALALSAESLATQQVWLNHFAQLEWATQSFPDPPIWAIGMGLLGTLVLLTPPKTAPKWLGICMLLPLFAQAPRPAEHDFWFTALDVGQGSAVAIQTRNHVLIYDTGAANTSQADNGLRVVVPWLKSKGHAHVDSLWVSHDDNDHSGGATSILQKTRILRFTSPFDEQHPLKTLAKHQATPSTNCHHMPAWTWDGVLFEPMALPSQLLNTHGVKDNDKSCVLRVSSGPHSVLLTGDLEARSEQALLLAHGAERLKSTVMLVPHHGSRTSSTAGLLDTVAPTLAVIQSGWRNTHGHPHREVLERYTMKNIDTLNTAQFGALELKFFHDSTHIQVRTAIGERRRYWHLHERGAGAP